MAFAVSSPAFTEGAVIPQEFTCEGRNHPPPIRVSAAPAGTRSFAVIMDDPDAPGGPFTHWLAYNIPAGGRELQAETAATLPDTPLIEPIEPAWPIASIALGYDEATRRIEIVATAVAEEDEEEEEPPTAKFAVTREQAAAFVARAEALMKAGRAICPMCSQPKDPGGHICPRSNGHVVHA